MLTRAFHQVAASVTKKLPLAICLQIQSTSRSADD